MSLIKKVIDLIESNHTRALNCIPLSDLFPRFSTIIPGIKKSTYYAITGTPGSSKTQFTDFTCLYHPVSLASENLIELDITYFSFEISKEAKLLKGISKLLFERYGIRVSTNKLQKIGSELAENELQKVRTVEPYFEALAKFVTFYDEPMTPSQIFKVMLDKLKQNGSYDEKSKIYKPYSPEKYIIFIFDHISLIQPDSGQSLHQALTTFSGNNIFFKNKFGATIVNVHQQGAEGGVAQFTTKGDNIASKLEPKLAGLADNRTLARDYDIILGLFSPFSHSLDFYRGYKAKRFEDKVRFLSVIKNREGISDVQVGLYFDGLSNYFEELPRPDEFSITRNGVKAENDYLYDKYVNGRVGPLDPQRQKLFNF